MNKKEYFISSVNLNNHPMIDKKDNIKQKYYNILFGYLNSIEIDKIPMQRLEIYREFLCSEYQLGNDTFEKDVKSLIGCKFRPWRKQYRYILICDIALITLDKNLIWNFTEKICGYFSKHKANQYKKFVSEVLVGKNEFDDKYGISNLIHQFHKNIDFIEKKEKRFIVTANMSAGKSTLINALIGKNITRTSQEVCTGNVCYLYNKTFEDKKIHLQTSELTINATQEELKTFTWSLPVEIATYFKGIEEIVHRLCFIDTPGVNSAINRNHKRITRDALQRESYEKVIHVLNANKLGTDEEISHLKWISKNIPKDKVIFVLNKLDDFNRIDDSVHTSIMGVRNDLWSLGYDNPIICPISAYFAMLIKLKQNDDNMTEDEHDEYLYYKKKFLKQAYDLSGYYPGCLVSDNDDEITILSKKCGLYGLEKMLFGGTS